MFPVPATLSVFSLYDMWEGLGSRKSSADSTVSSVTASSSLPVTARPPPPTPLAPSQYYQTRFSLPNTPDYADNN